MYKLASPLRDLIVSNDFFMLDRFMRCRPKYYDLLITIEIRRLKDHGVSITGVRVFFGI